MKILSFSRRQDAPSSATAMQDLLDGFKNGKIKQFGRAAETPMKNVGFIIFWSQYPSALEAILDQIPVPFYILFTITGLGSMHEPNVPSVQDQIDLFISLSKKLGKDRVIWRFDPVVIDDNITVAQTIDRFRFIGSQLHDYTNRVVFSFVDTSYLRGGSQTGYKYRTVSSADQTFLLDAMVGVASRWQLPIYSCAENLDHPMIKKHKCIDDELISKITGKPITYKKDIKQTRKFCQCHESTDVGSYASSCPFQCGYCYGVHFKSKHQNRQNQRKAKLNRLNSK